MADPSSSGQPIGDYDPERDDPLADIETLLAFLKWDGRLVLNKRGELVRLTPGAVEWLLCNIAVELARLHRRLDQPGSII